MASAWADKGQEPNPNSNQNQRDVTTQLVISVALGLFAFLGFCVSIVPLYVPVVALLVVRELTLL